MYPDPKRVRDNRLTLRLDDYEHELVQAMALRQGEQLSTLVRRMAVREAEREAKGFMSHGGSLDQQVA
jgi:uncharacterized protein (DUF1778 family)